MVNDRRKAIRAINILKKEIKKKVLSSSAEVMNNNIRNFFLNHPRGIGVTGTLMKPYDINGNRASNIITHFPLGYPAMLELGSDGSHAGYTYPYDKEKGTYVSFADEPNLELWAQKNNPHLKTNTKGLKIGGEKTKFGSQENKWFTKSAYDLVHGKNTKSFIIERLKNIKIKY